MSTIIETDLKEFLTQLESRIDKQFTEVNQKIDKQFTEVNQKIDKLSEGVNQKIDTLQKDVTNIQVEIANVRGDAKALDEKVNGLDKRLENQEFVSRGVLIALIVAILGSFAKLFGFIGNS